MTENEKYTIARAVGMLDAFGCMAQVTMTQGMAAAAMGMAEELDLLLCKEEHNNA